MNSYRRWIFSITLVIWLIGLAVYIYAVVYATPEDWARKYVLFIILGLIICTQFLKKAFKYSYRSDVRSRNKTNRN